jgi:hypothetical protein
MTHDGSREQAAALALLRKGQITMSEAGRLVGVSKQLVRHWVTVRDIDVAAAREAYLRRTWKGALR